MKEEKPKLYVIRKYVKATSVAQALRREPKAPVHEIFIDEQFQKTNLADAIGFVAPAPRNEEDTA